MNTHQDLNQESSTKVIYRLRVASISPQDASKRRLITHCLKLDNPNLRHETTLTVILEGVWSQTELNLGAIIHLIQPKYDQKQDAYIIDNSTGLLVFEPDQYISCTAITTALFCERKSWLNDIFLTRVGTHPNRLVGTIVHEVFLHALKNQTQERLEIMNHLDVVLSKPSTILNEILATGKPESFYREESIKYINNMKDWFSTYSSFASSPRHISSNVANNLNITMQVQDEVDIESIVESTAYGLKGKVDIAGKVRIHDKSSNTMKDIIAAIELKTGCDNPKTNPSIGHRGQLDLYTMILDDVSRADCDRGFVTYLKNGPDMYEACITHSMRRDLIRRRNQLIWIFKNPFVGPPFAEKTDACKSCDKLTDCLITHNLYDGNQSDYPKMAPLEPHALGHLDIKTIRFFKWQYERLTRLLEDNRDLSYEEFEMIGEGFRKLKRVHDDRRPEILVFERDPNCIENYAANENRLSSSSQPIRPSGSYGTAQVQMQLKPFDTSTDYSNCRVMVKPDLDPLALITQPPALGKVCEITRTRLAVKLFNKQRLEDYLIGTTCRIDKVYHERDSRTRTMRRTLSKFLERRDPNSSRLRKLVSDPSYSPQSSNQLRQSLEAEGNEDLFDLEPDQVPVVLNSVCAENYQLLTEKTIGSREDLLKYICVIVRLIIGLRRTTLIAARKVEDLKDMMEKLRDKGCEFLLVDDGKSTEVSQRFASNLLVPPREEHADPANRLGRMQQRYNEALVVLTTCTMTAESVLFARRTFDYCIAFDCDTTDMLVSLAPLLCAERHIIIDLRIGHPDPVPRHNNGRAGILSLGDHLRVMRAH